MTDPSEINTVGLTVKSRSDEPFTPGPILLLGAPGVGKGTQSQIIEARYSIPQISTGDLLRQNRRERTSLGILAEEFMSSGNLVPDDLVTKMVDKRLGLDDTENGYVLDGFPRTLAQAQWLDERSGVEPHPSQLVALEIQVEQSKLLRRVTGRRSCLVCNRIYNIYLNKPKHDGLCDDDGAELVQRADDTEKAFTRRMEIYTVKTVPVTSYYQASGRFRRIDGDADVLEVAQAIVTALFELRSNERH